MNSTRKSISQVTQRVCNRFILRVNQSVPQFLQVTDKRQWRDVLKSLSSFTATPNSGAVRTLQQYYMKMLLPYECHLKNLSLPELLVRFDNTRLAGQTGQTAGEKMNHTEDDSSKLDDALESLMEVKVNGESHEGHSDGRLGQRVNSQDSTGSSLQLNSQEESRMNSGMADGASLSQGSVSDRSSQKQDTLDIPEGSQNSVDTYSQGMSGIEHLPDISVQEAESVLGEDFSSYPGPSSQPSGGPGTPSVPNVPSPSAYPPQYPQQNSHARGEWPRTVDVVTPGSAECMPVMGDINDPSMMGVPPPPPPPPPMPPSYPPGYSMDPTSGYRPPSHPSPLHRYPYSPAAQMDMSPAHMMQSPYPGSSPYAGMSPSGPIPAARQLEGSPYGPNPYAHRSAMMAQPGQMMQRIEDLPPYGPPNMGMHVPPPGPEWVAWQQHRARFPAHMASPMQYMRHQQHQQFSPSPRPTTPQQAAVLSQMQAHHRASPSGTRSPSGGDIEGVKIHWQDQMKAAQMAKMLEKSSPRPSSHSSRSETSTSSNKSTSSRSAHHMILESLKRPLPDWSNCVEGTKPQLVKRRRLFSGDCGECVCACACCVRACVFVCACVHVVSAVLLCID